MNILVYHIASGHIFFTGITLIIIAAALSTRTNPLLHRIAVLAFVIGAVAITISSTAIPYFYYALAIVGTIPWAVSRYVKNWRRWAPYLVIAAWSVAAVLEIPYHITPTLQPATSRAITIIGDSVTAGMGGGDHAEKWPALLAKQHAVKVQDISHMGETAASALKRVQTHKISAPIVLLEIGGNDLLGSTSSAQFERDLDALLTHVAAPGRQLIMFELPLPPFKNEYGRIQLALARKHNVSLIAKPIFLSVLAAENSTLDTIHLSQSGHNQMAERVWNIVRTAFSVKTTAASELAPAEPAANNQQSPTPASARFTPTRHRRPINRTQQRALAKCQSNATATSSPCTCRSCRTRGRCLDCAG